MKMMCIPYIMTLYI